MKIKESITYRIFDILNYIFLGALSLVFFLPLWYVLVSSFSNGFAVMRNETFLFPVKFNMDSYKAIFRIPDFVKAYKNTIGFAGAGVFMSMILTILCAFPLSRPNLYGRKIFSVIVLLTMFFSGGVVPTYIIVTQTLQLRGHLITPLLISTLNVFNMILMRTFFQGLPESLFESARIDGANELSILAKIVLPLSKPILATVFLYYSVDLWNSYFNFSLYLRDHFPLQVFIKNFIINGVTGDVAQSFTGNVSDTTVKYAIIVVTLVPILSLYPFIQKYLIKGTLVGAIKG